VSADCGTGTCVGVEIHPDPRGDVLVWDTKEGEHAIALSFSRAEWAVFIERVKRGEFDV
jgi:hypothetical protein